MPKIGSITNNDEIIIQIFWQNLKRVILINSMFLGDNKTFLHKWN